jgi:hypothetical protein
LLLFGFTLIPLSAYSKGDTISIPKDSLKKLHAEIKKLSKDNKSLKAKAEKDSLSNIESSNNSNNNFKKQGEEFDSRSDEGYSLYSLLLNILELSFILILLFRLMKLRNRFNDFFTSGRSPINNNDSNTTSLIEFSHKFQTIERSIMAIEKSTQNLISELLIVKQNSLKSINTSKDEKSQVKENNEITSNVIVEPQSVPVKPEINVNQRFYSEAPKKNGNLFKDGDNNFIKSYDSSMPRYHYIVNISGDNGTFQLNVSSIESMKLAIENFSDRVEPFNNVLSSDYKTKVEVISPGKIKKVAGGWEITEKSTIKLS